MTPFAAREPYNAVALAPFSTCMLAMSSGFRSEKPFPKSIDASDVAARAFPELSIGALIGTPSTTIRALFPP